MWSIIMDSEAFLILTIASAVVPALFEIYLLVVTHRRVRDSVLGSELDAFFEKLQSKWAAKAQNLKSHQ